MERTERTHLELHMGSHAAKQNWLRAVVLGANDGIVSLSALVVGVAGAIIPLAAIVLPPAPFRIPIAFLAIFFALAATGLLSARVSGAGALRVSARVVVGGMCAMAITFGIGKLFGVVAQ